MQYAAALQATPLVYFARPQLHRAGCRWDHNGISAVVFFRPPQLETCCQEFPAPFLDVSHQRFSASGNPDTILLLVTGQTKLTNAELFHQPTLMHNFLYSLTICLLHCYPRHVSSTNMPNFRRKNCIHTASGIFALCKRLHSTLVESGLSPLSTNILCMSRIIM